MPVDLVAIDPVQIDRVQIDRVQIVNVDGVEPAACVKAKEPCHGPYKYPTGQS
jgi:hypothetical protein